MAMALCRRGGALIIKSIQSSSSYYSSSQSHLSRPVAALTEFTNGFPILSAASLSTHAAATTARSLSSVNHRQSDRKFSLHKDTDWLPGCDFKHWLVVMENPEEESSRDELIDTYVETLSKVLGSEEEARMKIYSVSTKHYFAFGALMSKELAYKLRDDYGVRWVLPDSYVDEENKDYGGEPFINGKAVPYDPKYHEVWVRNNNKIRAREKDTQLHPSRNFESGENNERQRDFQPNQQGGPPEDFSNIGNYQLGRATTVDTTFGEFWEDFRNNGNANLKEARMKIYSVSTKHYFAFGALMSEELAYKLRDDYGVRWVLPDSYVDEENKDYGGEPFINGKAVPYDPKYHEAWDTQLHPSSNFESRENNERQRDFQPNQPGGLPEDFSNNGNYQLGRSTSVDTTFGEFWGRI